MDMNVDLCIAMDMKTDLVWIIWIWIPVLVVKRKAYEDVDEIEDKGIGDCDRLEIVTEIAKLRTYIPIP